MLDKEKREQCKKCLRIYFIYSTNCENLGLGEGEKVDIISI